MLLFIVIFLAKKFAEMQPKKETPIKKEKGGKEGGKQPQQQPQQEKKEKKKEEKKAAPAEEEMDECEAALASEPKTKDPFAHLPKTYLRHVYFRDRYCLKVCSLSHQSAFVLLH